VSKVKTLPGFIPPRVIVAYARLTNTRPKYDASADRFDFVDELYPVREFRKRQIGTLDLNAIHLNGRVVA
jgi:hypothetical protein